jgi:hypothetical protein
MLPLHPVTVVVGEFGEGLVIIRVLGDHRRSAEEVSLVVKIVLGAERVCHGVELLSLDAFERVLDPGDGSAASEEVALPRRCTSTPSHSLGADVSIPARDMLPVRLEIEVVDLEELVVAFDRRG